MSMLEVKTDIVELIRTAKLPFKFYVNVDWPNTIKVDGQTFCRTSKEGTGIKNNLPSRMYDDCKGNEVWLYLDGTTVKD